jgi:3-oxoacyl-[acyl-carrier protein] reductase
MESPFLVLVSKPNLYAEDVRRIYLFFSGVATMKRFQGKVAVVTGGGRGIGLAITKQLLREGAQVIIAEIDEQTGLTAEQTLSKKQYPVRFVATDVSDSQSVQNLFQIIKQDYSRLDILINNAGILQDSTLGKLEEDKFERVIQVNLKGVYLCGRAAAEIMKEQGSGVIINATSVVALYGNFGQTNYVAAKAGVIGMTKVWARELARDGIRVNAVAPGFIKTDMTAGIPDKVIAMMESKIPLRRWGTVEEVAQAYCFLASDDASYINGSVLNVDGGVVV